MKYPLVVVEWRDALNTQDWQKIEDIQKTGHKVVSVGFLIEKNKHALVLAHGLDDDGNAESTLTIPKDWCRKIKRLNVPNKGTNVPK